MALDKQLDCGFLTDDEIVAQAGRFFDPYLDFDRELAEGASYDLRLGEEVYISGDPYPKLLTPAEPLVSIPRGQFALLMTKEYIRMPPDHLGFISIKFGKKAHGLVNISGFHVDPGFEGKLIFSVFNAGPSDVVLRYEEAVFMIFFYRLHRPVKKKYDGKMKGQKNLPTELVTSLKGTSASLSDVDKRVRGLEVANRIYLALLIAIAAGLLGLFLNAIIPH